MQTMRKRSAWRCAVFFAFALLAASSASAASSTPLPRGTFAVIPARSDVRARVSSTLHDFDVEAKVYRGEAVISRDSGNPVQLFVEFRVKEMVSGNFMRDQVMRSDVFEDARYPLVRFRSEKISLAGTGPEGSLRFQAEGTLNMHGVEKNQIISIFVSPGGDRILARAEFPLRISDYGMKVPSPLPFLHTEDVVKVTVRIVLHPGGD
ncbi:MAG: YceI family protein [Candidatus Tectomicrobia bacterium]|uniref:YceI family protein n=1 Tax=Tectimicrobiota bacterium TaxID=2528274 RepID=A0A932HYY8_UNCTE|nr:YceI family protein [Candidatus Tectomicrobia bacterium]